MTHRQTKATDIPGYVKDKVWARVGGVCVWCGKRNWDTLPEAHYIPRSKGGKGIEENILTLCRYTCHERYDRGSGDDRENMRLRFKEYLRSKYPEWDESKLIYYKYGGDNA